MDRPTGWMIWFSRKAMRNNKARQGKLGLASTIVCLLVVSLTANRLRGAPELGSDFRAGAAAVNIDPPKLPVLKNGGFLQSVARKVSQPLFARSLVLSGGGERIAICVVDTCMVDRELCDRAKALASGRTNPLPPDP